MTILVVDVLEMIYFKNYSVLFDEVKSSVGRE